MKNAAGPAVAETTPARLKERPARRKASGDDVDSLLATNSTSEFRSEPSRHEMVIMKPATKRKMPMQTIARMGRFSLIFVPSFFIILSSDRL